MKYLNTQKKKIRLFLINTLKMIKGYAKLKIITFATIKKPCIVFAIYHLPF